jgi:hypothetical protein
MPIANVIVCDLGGSTGTDCCVGLDTVPANGQKSFSVPREGAVTVRVEGLYLDSFNNRDTCAFASVSLARGATTTLTVSKNFTDASVPDASGPVASLREPYEDADGVEKTTDIRLSFDEYVDPHTIDSATFYLEDAQGSRVPGEISYADALEYNFMVHSLVFDPSADLAPGTLYTVTLTAGIKDIAGNAMAAKDFSFITKVEAKWTVTVANWWYSVPAMNADSIFLGTGTDSGGGGVKAFSLGGQEKWSAASESIWGISIDGSGYVHAGAQALDPADGSVELSYPTDPGYDYGDGFGRQFAIGADGMVFMDCCGHIRAYPQDSESLSWRYAFNEAATTGTAQSGYGVGWAVDSAGNLIVPWRDGNANSIKAISPDGNLVWETASQENAAFYGAVIAGDGTAYCACADGGMYAVAPASPHSVTRLPVAATITGLPAIDAEGMLWVPAQDNASVNSCDSFLYRINPATQTVLWKSGRGQLNEPVRGSPAIDGNGVVYVATGDAMDGYRVAGFDTAGRRVFIAEAGRGDVASPMIAPDGSLIVYYKDSSYSNAGTLAAYDTHANGLANAAWPCYQANEAHAGRN